jgi:hypothetical protein
MNPIQLRHIREALRRDFTERIDLSDISNHPQQERDQAFLSRALAAMALQDVAGCDADQAAASVIDGQDDNGIDAVAARLASPHVWLVQAKWSDHGRAGLDLGVALKLKRGLEMLMNSEYNKFNARFQKLAEEVDAVLGTPAVAITIVIALLGSRTLASEIQDQLDRMCAALNADAPMIDMVVLGFADFYRIVREGIAGPRIDLDALIESWGRLGEPYSAYYGTVPVLQVAEWYANHGERLFAKNIRDSLGLTEVNRGLMVTLLERPEHFWYFNNGITVLCESIQRTARFASNAAVELRLNGASIVNGAQTVVSIHNAIRQAPDEAAAGRVWVRCISLEHCPEGFANDVTRATNTQNQVEERDFVALDPDQTRLRDEFSLSLHKTYVFKRSETNPSLEAGCSVVEAAEALACAHQDPKWVARAKRDRQLLWERGSQGAYQALFGRGPSAYRVWRSVQVLRTVDQQLGTSQGDRQGRAAAIAREAKLLTAHLVFQSLDLERIDDPEFRWDDQVARVPELTESVLNRLIYQVDAEFGTNSYPITVFKNAERCELLVQRVLEGIRTGQPIPELPPDYRPPVRERGERRSRAVHILVNAHRIEDGPALEFRAATGPERRALTAWLAEDPRRGQATWRNHRGSPLLWAADGKPYSPTGLVMHMLRAVGARTKAVQGTSRWFVRGEGSLTTLADDVHQEEMHVVSS